MMTRVKKIFSSRAFYIIFSVLASLTIWLYVEYIENPDVSVTVRNIKIEFLHEDYVADRGLIITYKSTDAVTARFTGKRNIVSQLTNTNLTATVDLSDVDTTGQYQLPYKINFPLDIGTDAPSVANISDSITLKVDKLSEKSVKVQCSFTGSLANGFQAESPEPDPSFLKIYGPDKVLSEVSYVLVSFDRENVSKTIDENLPFILMDESGHEVVSDQLTFSNDTIHVVMRVVMVKDVPLVVNTPSGAGADETNSVITITPASIKLSGDAEILKDLNQIPLGTIDLSSFLYETSQAFEIKIPNGTTNLTGITEAQVNIKINGLESVHVNATNIQILNPPAGYTATLVTSTVDVVVRGVNREELDTILPENIRIVADLSELGASTGVFSIPAKVYVDGTSENTGAIGEYKIYVSLTKT